MLARMAVQPLASTETFAAVPSSTGFHSVLACLDRSAAAEAVLPLATYLAKIHDASLILFHVLEGPPDALEIRATDALECEIARQEAHAYLAAISQRMVEQGVRVETRVAEGHAARGVAAMATELGADLIAVSRFGAGGRDEWNLGDTAQKILAVARSAVLVVSPDAHEPAPRVPPRTILVPLDGSLRGESVLPAVLRLARPDDAEIVLAHVVPDPVRTEVLRDPGDLALAQDLTDRLAARAEAYLARIRTQLQLAGARAITTVSRAVDHREGIASLAAVHQIDLVVLTAHGAVCNPCRRFGSLPTHMIANATAPVLVLQDLAPIASRADAGDSTRLPPRSSDGVAGRA